MPFYDELQDATRGEQEELFRIPFVRGALDGSLALDTYIAFLTEAYHHVKHTVPLLMACGARLPESHEWLRVAVGHYIEEETGHQEWILDDIEACGRDREAVRHGKPSEATEMMVAYAYDLIHRRDPLGFFGMVHVLEGTSVRGATSAATALQYSLGLPPSAFTYLTTHGDLDIDHVGFFEGLMNRVTDPAEKRWITHCSRRFFTLYGNIFRGLLPAETLQPVGAGGAL